MKTIKAFIWGSAIGAVLGLLFAPQRGDLTRAQLQERFTEWQNMAQSRLGNLPSTASSAIETGRQAINSGLSQAQSAASAAAERARGTTTPNTAADQAQSQVGSSSM